MPGENTPADAHMPGVSVNENERGYACGTYTTGVLEPVGARVFET